MRRIALLAASFLLLAVPGARAWTWPAGGDVLGPFVFDRAHPYAGGQHRGIDIAAAPGETIVAPAAGAISFAGTVPGGGPTLTILTPDGYAVTLLHLGSLAVGRGAAVAEGQAVGAAGGGGSVYLGVRLASDPQGYVDPLGFLPVRAVPAPAAPAPAAVPEPVPPPPAAAPAAADRTGFGAGRDGALARALGATGRRACGRPSAPAAAPPDPGPHRQRSRRVAVAPAAAPQPAAPAPAADPAPADPDPLLSVPVDPTTVRRRSRYRRRSPSSRSPCSRQATRRRRRAEQRAAPGTRRRRAGAGPRGHRRRAGRRGDSGGRGPHRACASEARCSAAALLEDLIPRGDAVRVRTGRHAEIRARTRRRPRARAAPRGAGRPIAVAPAHAPRATPRRRVAPWAPLAAALGLLGTAGLALSRRSGARVAPPIIDSDALLPDDTDLLRERQAPHRPRVHDDRGRRPDAPSPAARRPDVASHGCRRARARRWPGWRRSRGSSPRSTPTASSAPGASCRAG